MKKEAGNTLHSRAAIVSRALATRSHDRQKIYLEKLLQLVARNEVTTGNVKDRLTKEKQRPGQQSYREPS